jgi:Protein of unknown function (DUF2637)
VSGQRPASEQAPRFRHRVARVLGHIAVVIGILAVIAAAFALSYDAVRDIARAAGVPVTLARIYPGILDAVFLVACAAALMLRDARWWTRLYTWLSVLVTGGLIGAADAYHSMGLRLPQRTTAGTIAALPWALVMLAFSLWLSMLRHSRSGPAVPSAGAEPAGPDEIAGPALALAASPAARAALPAPEPEPVNQPSINNIEGRSAENPPPAEVTADEGPEERATETGAAAGTAGPADSADPADPADSADSADASPDDGDDEVLGDQEDQPSSPTGPHPSDADTPPYGFPAVTAQAAAAQAAAQNGSSPPAPATADHDEAVPAARTPTLLSAPVPADVAAPPEPPAAEAEPEGEAESESEPSEREDVAAKGRPPAASPELSGAEAELAHEGRPAKKPPAPFERVRSTPTRPAGAEDD